MKMAVKIDRHAKRFEVSMHSVPRDRRKLTADREVRDVLQRARQREKDRDAEPVEREDDSAGRMLREDVHHNAERCDVRCHDEDQNKKLADTEQLPADWTEQDHACISHACALRML